MASRGTELDTTRAGLCGLALVAVVLAAIVGFGSGIARAATLEPCEAIQPPGPTVELEGQLELSPVAASRKVLRRSGIRQNLVKPARVITGRPTYPVGKVAYGNTVRVDLLGSLKLSRKKRSIKVTGLTVYSAAGKPAIVRGTVRKRAVNLFKVQGGKREFDADSGELARYGTARLTAAGAKVINRNLATGRKKLRAGTVWGYFNLYALYKVTQNEDPEGETPVAPPVKTEPLGASPVQGAATIKWYVRDTWVDYVSSGVGIWADDGATADPPSGPKQLAYSFNFPFDSGWTVPEALDRPENTLIRGKGSVGFKFCAHTINFTTSDPEIEIDGDDNSRLIFRVNGLDGTAFPDQRAVMVKLIPSLAEDKVLTDNGDGTHTVSYTKIPGFIPADATGIFAGFYPAYSPEFEGQSPRPDRFGSFSITYTYAEGST